MRSCIILRLVGPAHATSVRGVAQPPNYASDRTFGRVDRGSPQSRTAEAGVDRLVVTQSCREWAELGVFSDCGKPIGGHRSVRGNAVDLNVLRELTDADLDELGGFPAHRRKLREAIIQAEREPLISIVSKGPGLSRGRQGLVIWSAGFQSPEPTRSTPPAAEN
jgi:hypothetical protein